MDWNFAVPNWSERLRLGKSLMPNIPLNMVEANRAVGIYNKLRIPDIEGQPSMLVAAGEWQRDIVRGIFGSLDENGNRHVREIFALVPKKSSKTTTAAGVAITTLLINNRPRAEIDLVGPTQEVADLAFQQASGMIEADPDGYLQKRFQIQEHVKTIVDRKNKTKLKIKTFDLKVATGSKPIAVIIDELHLMSSMSFATRVIGQLRGGMVANPEAFMVFITTQSDEAPSGVFKSELAYARGIRDGRITKDVHTLPILYEFSEAMQTAEGRPWADPMNWPQVLPNLNKSITIERMISDYAVAKEKGEEEERRWASQHLNVEIGLALHDGRWRGADYWLGAANEELKDLDALIARSEVLVVGGDGGGLDDLLGLAVLGRDAISKDWLLWCHAWAQSDVFEKRKDIVEKLIDFEKDGDLTVCQAGQTQRDIVEFCDTIEKVFKSGKLPEKLGIGLDPYSIGSIIDELALRDIHTEANGGCITGIRQGSALSPASWGMERKLKDKTLWHGGSAMMRWCVSNAKAEQRGNAILITKQTAGKAKIDPLVAAFNAVMLMGKNPEATGNATLVLL